MKKKFVRLISAVLSAAMTLTAVPLSAFAEGEAHTHDGESNVITTPLDFREKTADENGVGWSWDYDTKTLTLDGVNIQATTEENMMSVVTVPDGTKIVLNGENTIVQTDTLESDTYVLSAVNNKEVNCDGTMTISGDGVLNAENRSTDSMARSLGGSIILNGGTVNATGTVKTNSLEIHNDGVLNANATTASFEGVAVNVSGGITVDGNGSLTAVGCANESTLNSAILLTGNFGDKISVSENGSITVPEGNAARVGIYYSGNNGDGMDAEISGGKVTAYGAKYGIYKVNLIMSGTGSVYTTGGSYAIGLTVPTIDENRFTVKGSTEFKASESAVTGEVKYNSGYYEIGGADAKTVVIKPDTSPRIILGKQTGIFKTEEYEIIEGMTDTKLKGTVYFDITLKNMSDEEFADARGYFGGDEPDLLASIIKTDYGWVCMVCDTEFSTTYDTDNTLTIKCGDIVSNTVQVKSNANRFNKVTQGDNTNRTVFYTNTSQEEKDNYKLVSTYTVDSESISYNWYSTNSAYSADELGAAVSGSNGEFKLADNIPAGNYVLYCDITYSDGDSTETVTEKFTFTYKECAHENGYSDGKCTNCGALCDHSNIDIDTGKCNECEYQYAAVIVKDGAVASVYEENEMGAAFEAADSDANTGCTLKVYKNYAGSYTTLSRKFTLWIAEEANVGTLTVSGDITVTGSEKNNSIYGDFNVVDGGKLTFDENCGAKGTVSVGAGTFDCYRSLGIILNINDASSDVILHDGAFLKIRYNGGGDRANAEILTLLAENRMFMTSSAVPIDGSKTLLKDGFVTPVIVAPHEDHSYDSTTGKCTICGKRCGHTDVDSKTGMCKTCQYEFVATLTVGDKVTGFDSLSDCLSKTSEDSENYVKIYKNIDDRTTINVNHTVTVDLNSHKLYYIELKVNNDNGAGNLTLTGSEDSYISQVDVCGGRTFKIDSDANINFETIFVEAGARFEVSYGANVTVNTLVVKESLKLYGRTTTSVRLATGMRIGTLMYELDRNSGSGNLLLYSLLGEGKALQYDNSGEYVDIYEKFTSKIIHDSFTVVDHYEHSYDKATGKCVCGYVCPHSDVDSKTGVCSICKYQFTAGISGVGTAKYFDNIDDAFTAALSEENSGCTLTLYKDCSLSTSATITNATVTVDVNGCSLGGEADISVNNGGVLYLKDSRKSTYYGCIDAPFSVNGGTLINGTADGGSSAADVLNLVINSAKRVEIYGGIFENVYIAHASGVALYGGRYNTICGEESNSTPVNDLLAKGYAFATVQEFTTLPESIVDGSAKTIGDGLTNVMVVAHEHRYNVETGKCPCGVCALAIFTETTQSSETYTFIESETQFKNIAENEADGVLKLTGDVDCIVKGIIINGNKTIDMNGHTLNVSVGTEEISAVAVYGNVTFENSGSSRAVINATGVYSYGMVTVNGDIEFDTFATFEDGDALINAGVFKSIYVQGRSVIEILGSGKALASESGEILNASVQQIYRAGDNIFVTAHPKHTYDDHGNCACGYKCLHDGEGQVNEDSANKVCSECGAKIYAKVTTADGKVKYFDDITEGLRYADKAENKGCVFTLVTTGGLENDITLSSGQFTITAIDDNYINAYTRKINIKGAEITVENCAFNCFVGLYSGSLTYPEGSTSVCINGISVFGGTLNISDGVSENFGANKFTISDTATDAKVTIGGGIYGEIKLGQYTFKDILASGTRLISVEYSQETDEIIATNELLYSIVSEQNTLGVDDDKDYRFVKCDHKNEDGSYAFNDSGICKYCNSEFAASVSYTDGGEKTELFSDICDAFDKANEIGTATVTLYKDITDSERTQEITVMGNVTLELNGKTLGGRYGIARISVSDGGTLTVNGDGDMDTPIYVNENSKLVINGGGYFNSVSVKKGGNAEIGGGTIQGLSVRGNVKLSGGKFNDIEIFNGNLESVLADGYAYKNADGTWLSIDEREKDSYLGGSIGALSVEEAPIKSASIAWVGEEAPVIYRNGEKYLYVDITYELAVGSRGATYSDFVNGNNRIKDYNLYNKYMVHCYEIGKLAAKDGEVEYYIVLKCNGYEYKSNVLKLTLATCSHPKDSFSYENDGFVICGICDALIEAEVVDADGKSLGYADIESAIKLAQENEGSTVKLMSEGVSESVTVTGGRFTVDFNGKKVFYQFDVNGGDVTFTSSVKQADVETLISGIEVNGADAKVTIDGKIKLGSVTLTSGALAVNSAESYIKELSINGGKTVVNGANIDALKANGGDTVINYVTADSLSVNINGSGSISIVTGEFGSTTCKTGLGMAIASGSVVSADSMNGITVYTYEAIQTMTSTYRIFVDKCNHKDKNGSYVLDGNPCPYCNEEIVATVSYTADGGEMTDLFSDIYDAFAKANEAEKATVTLQKNITDDITDTIAVTGNVTLELNGKRLSQPGTDVWYSIEVTSGKLTVNGSGLIKRVAVCNGSNAEINGGTFSDFIIKDGGNAVIKGGQFYSLQVSGEGRNVGQLLADGYAYWSFIDSGIWSTIAEREKQDIANVEVKEAPIKSATITANDESPIIYRNGRKTASFTADVTYTGNETLYVTGCLIDGTVIKEKTDLSGNRYYLFSGEVDKAVAEDGEIQYYCIFTYDGYEYKSNAVTLTVATCQHPGASVKCDDNGNYVCGICNRALTASVELSDGMLSYYGKWNDAISAAQESEGCTLKLLNYSWLKDNETFDISKGRFTVDLNKNDSSGPFAFNVKGGDITFTALKKASISFTGVTVSGENANVLIDSKATLNYLVVNSGKVSADGANIGAITINGGDTVINYVTADSLSVNINGSGSISIVTGEFGSTTCKTGLGMAIASGSVVSADSMNGITVYTYEAIQTMTSTYRIFVDKCNHKDKNGSYVLDGNPCPYCNEEIVATVSYTADGGEMTDLFSDIYDAFAKANEAEKATVTLQKNITDDITDTIAVTGNVTLELNGKRLSQPGTDVWYSIEVTSGKLTVNGSGLIKRVAVCNGSNAEINGGTFSDFIIKDGGNAVIKGGQFYSLQVSGEGRNVGQLLADGYAYWSFIDSGIWSTIAEREKQDIANVEVKEAPIKSATITANDESPIIYRNGRKTASFTADVTYTGNETLYVTGCLIDGTVIKEKTDLSGNRYYLFSGEVDKAVAEDGEIQYYCIFTYDGYEYKSNAVTLTVATCQHPGASVKCDDNGNYVCGICNRALTASVELSDGMLSYYGKWNDAISAAQESEGCTLKLLNYSWLKDNETFDISKGRFTVDLNKNDSSGPFAFNVKGGDITFTALKKASISFTGVTVSGENANVLIDSKATLNYLVVNSGKVSADGANIGAITINGGNVTMAANNINCLTINGGNVSISSGGFAEIVTTVSDKVIADYIDPGFWVQDRGTKEWIDIYSLNKATASSTNGLTVRLCPMQIIKPIDTVYYTNGYYPDGIPSLQISAVPWYSGEVDAKVAYQWIAIDENGYETVIEGATDRKLSLENLTTGRYYCRLTYSNAATAGVSMKSDVVTATITECEHSGGEATCTKKAKCEICGAEYGEPLGHDYVVIKVVEPDYFNKGYSVFECTRCEDTYLGNYVPVKPIPDVEEIAVEKTTYNEVDISWKDISDVDGFNVECYVGDQWKKIDCSAEGDRAVAKLSGLSAGLKYKVRIVAYAGSVIGKYRYFYVDTVPSPVWNINTVKATDETVRISWNRNTRADGYKVEWYIDNQWSVKTVTGNNNIAAVIDGLCAGTRYKVRVSAYKGDLYSPYTYGYINTLPSKVTGITQTVTSSSFTLKWDKNESADGYTVQYYADGKWNEKSLVGNDKTTVTIGSLKGYKTYKVRIKAYKGELQSTFDDIYITTAPTKVDGLKVKSAVDSKAVVIWNADATADGYNVGYYIGGKWVEKTITDNKTAMAELDGLTPYSTYKVRVRAYKGNLYGDYSYTTVTAVLSPVTNIKVVSAKSNSITVKWGKNASADGYKVEIYKGGKWVKKTLKGSTNATVTIGGLRAGSVYKVRIASYKGANTSTFTYANVNTAK